MVRTSKEFPGIEWLEISDNFIKIVKEKCIGCGNCVNVCLAGCFGIIDKKANIISLEFCMECSACWYICTENAIEFNWPRGGEGFNSKWG